MILVSHPTGNTFVRAWLAALTRRGVDFHFHTTLGVGDHANWLGLLPDRMAGEIQRRAYQVPSERLHARPWRELARLAGMRCGWNWLTARETGWCCVDAVYQSLDRSVARVIEADRGRTITAVYAYEDGALASFEAAHWHGIKCCYELPIAYWETARRLLREEAARWPAWEPTLEATQDSEAKLERKTRELELADVVICPSQFVLRSLPGAIRQAKSCLVSEFGAEIVQIPEPPVDQRRAKRPLRVLFAGSMTQRKGLADVFAAFRGLRRTDCELVVMGSPRASMDFYRHEYAAFTYEQTRPHSEVLDLMKRCDVLVLPSIVEGRALVQQEAMMCGLPIVVTSNAGGEDLVEEGRTGFLVPIRSPEAVAERLSWLADHRDQLAPMGEAARQKARQYTWEQYAQKIAGAVLPS